MQTIIFPKTGLPLLVVVLLSLAVPAFALHPETRIPDRAYAHDQSCKILLDMTAKYKIDGVFPKEFAEGKQCLSRIELAASLHLIEEKLAEKVVREGSESVSREDLDRLNDIEEDLRSEMLLVRTRAFQTRNEGLGTNLYPLTKNISISGSLVGTFQNTVGNKQQKDGGDVVGRGDLVFDFKITDTTIAVVNIRAAGGQGVDSRVGNLAGLNGLATTDGDNVRFYKAFLEQSLFDDRLIATLGKIDIADYFDTNAVANDETSQFLAGLFTNSPTLSLPSSGPGMRVHAKLGDMLTFGIGYGSSTGSGDRFTSNGYGIAGLDAKIRIGGLEGNYRLYGAIDGAKPDGGNKIQEKNAYNAGISIDQQLTDRLTLFARLGQRERNVYALSRSWSAGVQYNGLIPGRDNDAVGIAYGQISGKGDFLPSQEKLMETYYNVKLHDKVSLAPVYQLLINPAGNQSGNYGSVSILGIRTQIIF